MTCGIYQITNQVNGKFYIGQSRNIKRRWRQHIGGLDKENALQRGSYPLRAAFKKYGLKQFKFEIIEECGEAELLERESFWIETVKPQYNCNLWTPGKGKPKDKTHQSWIQYHKYNELGHIPGELELDNGEGDPELAGLSTGKRAILNAKGDTAYLIVGIGYKPQQYYLLYRFTVEEIQIREDAVDQKGSMSYDAFGNGWFIDPPQLLNSPQFNEFQKYCGNFAFGLMAVDKSPYLKILEELSERYKAKEVDFSKYIEDFYTKVLETNPNEVSLVDKRGIARHLAISLYPDEAALVLAGGYTKFVFFGVTNAVASYRGRLLIHSLDFYEKFTDQRFQENCLSILEKLGYSQETFPSHAIQGWVNVDNIFQYDQQSFALDQDAHGQGDDLDLCRQMRGFSSDCEVWCVEISQPITLDQPIPLNELEDVQEGDPWFPCKHELKAFKLALENVVYEQES
ncbi:GIY-YIG nuclease family protein [Pantanalinema rosaneae CENA516]|uniref:GIY-YIG nuclease family protein n=1 Tax=Pantanalinema rosaneae TaxID=1620701 RepID=UPI003D6EE62B